MTQSETQADHGLTEHNGEFLTMYARSNVSFPCDCACLSTSVELVPTLAATPPTDDATANPLSRLWTLIMYRLDYFSSLICNDDVATAEHGTKVHPAPKTWTARVYQPASSSSPSRTPVSARTTTSPPPTFIQLLSPNEV